jgi:putative transposase
MWDESARRRSLALVAREDGPMPRRPRLQVPGGTFHVFARGVRKNAIFGSDDDREYFLNLFALIAERHGWITLAYCLMTNHFHLLFQTPEANLSAGMHRQLGAVAQRFNGLYDFEGHVFERRFQSVLAKSDAHLLELLRYVVMNPVRARVCAHPIEYRWSSYCPTVGVGRSPRFLARRRVLDLFEGPGGTPEEHYERFVTRPPDVVG